MIIVGVIGGVRCPPSDAQKRKEAILPDGLFT